MGEATSLLLQVATGIALAACAGLRAFLPLLVVGVAARFDLLRLSPSFAWLESGPALVILGVAVAAELLGDKFPIVDHVLDLVGSLVKPAAGAVVATSVLTDLTPLQAAVVGILGGASSAGVVHFVKAKVRLFSTATTAGFGSPILSLGEDVASLAGSIVAIFLPLLLLFAVFATFVVLLLARHRLRLRAERLGR